MSKVNVKFLALLVIVLVNLLHPAKGGPEIPEEMQELLDQLHNTCVEETGTKDEYISRARNGDFENDEKFKCYFKCIFDQMACISDDGIVDEDAVVALFPPEIAPKMEPTVRKCGTQKGANPCENAWLTHICYQKGVPDLYMLP